MGRGDYQTDSKLTSANLDHRGKKRAGASAEAGTFECREASCDPGCKWQSVSRSKRRKVTPQIRNTTGLLWTLPRQQSKRPNGGLGS